MLHYSMGLLAVVQQWIGADPLAFVELSMCRNLEWAQRHGYEFQFHRDASARASASCTIGRGMTVLTQSSVWEPNTA